MKSVIENIQSKVKPDSNWQLDALFPTVKKDNKPLTLKEKNLIMSKASDVILEVMRQLMTGEYVQKPITVSIEGSSYVFEPIDKNALFVFNNESFRKTMKGFKPA